MTGFLPFSDITANIFCLAWRAFEIKTDLCFAGDKFFIVHKFAPLMEIKADQKVNCFIVEVAAKNRFDDL